MKISTPTLFILLGIACLCGCSSSTDPQPNPAPQVDGTLVLPAGMSLAAEDLRIWGPFGTSPVNADGSFATESVGTGQVLRAALDDADNVILLGFVDPVDKETGLISVHETAAAILFQALRVFSFPGEEKGLMLDQIRAHEATAVLATAIETALAEDVTALMDEESELMADISTAVSALTDAAQHQKDTGPRATVALNDGSTSVLVQPSAAQSGVLVGPNTAGFGLQVTNLVRRHAWYFVYKTGFEDEEGLLTQLDPPLRVRDGYIPATSGISSTVGTVIDWGTGQLGFQPVSLTEPVSLELETGERQAFFDVVVAGSHFPEFAETPAWFAGSSNPDKAMWQTRAGQMTFVTMLKEVALPAILGMVLPIAEARDFPVGPEQAATLISAIGTTTPDVLTKIERGEWFAATTDIIKALADNSDLRAVFGNFATEFLTERLGDGAEDALHTLGRAAVFVKAIDVGLTGIDVGIVLSDHSDVAPLERWDAAIIDFNVRLEPEDLRLLAGWSRDFHAAAPVEGEKFYIWTTSGELGALRDADGNSSRSRIETTTPTITFVADHDSESGSVQVGLSVEVIPPGETARVSVGSTNSTVTIQSRNDVPDDPCDPFDTAPYLSPFVELDVWPQVARPGDFVFVEVTFRWDLPGASEVGLQRLTVGCTGAVMSHVIVDGVDTWERNPQDFAYWGPEGMPGIWAEGAVQHEFGIGLEQYTRPERHTLIFQLPWYRPMCREIEDHPNFGPPEMWKGGFVFAMYKISRFGQGKASAVPLSMVPGE